MKQYIKDLLLAITAGIIISISCIAFLSIPNKIIGSILFSAGLFTILNFKLNLFTGKAHYICKSNFKYCIFMLIIWLGNFIGVILTSSVIRYSRIYNKIIFECTEIANTKVSDNLVSLFILSVFCGILMCLSVETFKQLETTNILSANLIIIFYISIFIQAGFEHCIADMFYFTLALPINKWVLPLIIITLGNTLGGNIFYLIINMKEGS